MLKLYEYDERIEKALSEGINEETGELVNFELLEQLACEKDEKIKHVALAILNMEAEAKAYYDLVDKYTKKHKTVTNKIKSLKQYLTTYADKEKYTFPECNITFIESYETVITDKEAFEKYAIIRHKELYEKVIKPNKSAIKEAIRNGIKVKGVKVVKKSNIQIK